MKKALITTLQVLVTVGILYYVLHDPKQRAAMLDAWHKAKLGWLAAGFWVYAIVEICATVRWHILLRVQGIHLGWIRTAMLLMIGMFFNLFLPGAVSGDVVKIYYLLKETPAKKAAAFLTVLMDRLIGLLALISLAGVFIAANFHWLTGSSAAAKLVYVALIILAAGFFGVASSFVITGLRLVHKLPKHMPFHDKFVELSVAYNSYGRAWKESLAGFVLSIIAHSGYFVTFWCAGQSFGAASPILPSLPQFFAIMPIVNTITSMPISISGLGARELIFQTFLYDLCGIEPAIAKDISLAGFFVMASWAAVGGIIYLCYRPSEHARLRDIEHEVEEIEEKIAHAE